MKTAISNSNLRSLRGSHLVVFMAATMFALLGGPMAPAQTASSSDHAARPVAVSQRQAAAIAALQTEKTESEAKPDDASHQGIKVHGHWKIVVKNPDGTLASTNEFENSLVDGGMLFSYLLAGQATVGEAAIQLSTLAAVFNGCSPPYCFLLIESSTGYWVNSTNCTGTNQSNTCYPSLNASVPLQTTYDSSGNAHTNASLVLSGSFVVPATAAADQLLAFVSTQFSPCSVPTGRVNVSPAQCYANQVPAGTTIDSLPTLSNYFSLTGTLINPIQFSAGQTVQATVTLSFS